VPKARPTRSASDVRVQLGVIVWSKAVCRSSMSPGAAAPDELIFDGGSFVRAPIARFKAKLESFRRGWPRRVPSRPQGLECSRRIAPELSDIESITRRDAGLRRRETRRAFPRVIGRSGGVGFALTAPLPPTVGPARVPTL